MQHDDVIWSVIGPNFCSFRVKSQTLNFCNNTYNNTGLCNRTSCPLANSRYATVLEQQGHIYLCTKSIERAHMPNKLWEKIQLPNNNYSEALQQIDTVLAYWPTNMIHRVKQRVTKIYQYLIKIKQLKLQQRTKTVGVYKKRERQERSREAKAERAARITDSIETELLNRLQSGVYSASNMDYIPNKVYKRVLDVVADENAQLQDNSDLEENEQEIEYEAEYDDNIDFDNNDDFNDIDDNIDIEDDSTFNFGGNDNVFDIDDTNDNTNQFDVPTDKTNKTNKTTKSTKNNNKKKGKRAKTMEIEYEYEQEPSEIQTNIER